ncbi:MAG: CDP-glycerol glycerophosphotransferase family protein [Anaerovoracaceae bacterium]
MIKEIIGRIKKKCAGRNNPRNMYLEYLESLPIDDNAVLAEGSRGSNADGNTFYCVRELITNPDYDNLDVNVVVSDENSEAAFRARYGRLAGRVEFVIHGTSEYYRKVATCRYLINDATFAPFFIKREGQVLLNTWHGTPLKTMGRRNASEFDVLGNVQHNLCMADYILSPNPMTERIMTEDYMINDICRAKQVRCGYPRNIVFFDSDERASVKRAIGLSGMRVYAYMPTWRGLSSGADEAANRLLEEQLERIDKQLHDDEVMIANLHHLSRTSIDWDRFRHIRCFPDEIETYRILNAADLLITDYSSVLFDYAVSGRSVILFTYDKEDYERGRGFNLELSELPFARADSVDELMKLIRRSEEPSDMEAFAEQFCPWDGPDSAAELVRLLVKGDTEKVIAHTDSNGKSNYLIYSGALDDAEAIDAARYYLSKVFDNNSNWYLGFYSLKSRESAEAVRALISEFDGLRYLEFRGAANRGLDERTASRYEYERLLGSMSLDRFIMLGTSDGRIERLLEAVGKEYEKR